MLRESEVFTESKDPEFASGGIGDARHSHRASDGHAGAPPLSRSLRQGGEAKTEWAQTPMIPDRF
jgi:hypothetical protein